MTKEGKVIAFHSQLGKSPCRTPDEFAQNFTKYAESLIQFEWKRPTEEILTPYSVATIGSLKTANGFKFKPKTVESEDNNSDPGRIKLFPNVKVKPSGPSE